IGTSYTPGRTTCPLTPTNFNPRDPPTPAFLYHSTPRTKICGTIANVSTLLITVGFCHKPATPGNGGLFRGSARCPSIASSSALSSPQMYPPGLTNTSSVKSDSLPRIFFPNNPALTHRRNSSPKISSCNEYSCR